MNRYAESYRKVADALEARDRVEAFANERIEFIGPMGREDVRTLMDSIDATVRAYWAIARAMEEAPYILPDCAQQFVAEGDKWHDLFRALRKRGYNANVRRDPDVWFGFCWVYDK